MKLKFKLLYMTIAETVATMSHAKRLQVGAIVVKDDRVISMGYNGMPSGWENTCENTEYVGSDEQIPSPDEMKRLGFTGTDQGWYRLKTKPEVLHAESNAIAKLAKSNDSGNGADIFITHAPCIECAKLIYQSGISRVWYGASYRSDDGINFLKTSGIAVEQIEKGQ
jgi:dCMP deaminase